MIRKNKINFLKFAKVFCESAFFCGMKQSHSYEEGDCFAYKRLAKTSFFLFGALFFYTLVLDNL